MDQRSKKLELQFTSESTYLQACVIPKDHRTRWLSPAAHVPFLRSVKFIVVKLSQLCSLFREALFSELAAMAEEEISQRIWRTYFGRKTA